MMRASLRSKLAAGLAIVLALPAAASAVIVLATPPVAGWLPAWLLEALRPLASMVYAGVARLPADSLAGQVFYGSFAPLPALFGGAALAVHAILMGLPWAVLAALAARAAGATAPRPRPMRTAVPRVGRG